MRPSLILYAYSSFRNSGKLSSFLITQHTYPRSSSPCFVQVRDKTAIWQVNIFKNTKENICKAIKQHKCMS